MTDNDGVQPYNESLRTIAVYRSDLTQMVNKYNNFQIDLSGIPNFDGTGESAWHFIQTLKVIMRARNWPTGETGAVNIISAEAIYGEDVRAATGAGQVPFSRDIATATPQQKADGLAKRQPWNIARYGQFNQAAAGAGGAGLNSSPTLAQNIYTNPELDGYQVLEGTHTIGVNGRLTTVQTCFPRALGKFHAAAAPANGTTFQFGPINDCIRSRRLINALKTRFIGSGRDWLLNFENIPENLENFPRTLFSHRFNGQVAKANG